MQSPRHIFLKRLLVSLPAVLAVACATPVIVEKEEFASIESLQDFEYIYVLGPHDIPNGDGLQDRPRIRLWDRDGKIALKAAEQRLYGETQREVLAMLGSAYKTVDSYKWHHHFHHIGESHQGGIALPSGVIVGWMYRPGGLGYFDFDYNPVVEKVSYFTPRVDTHEPTPPAGRIYRVRSHALRP